MHRPLALAGAALATACAGAASRAHDTSPPVDAPFLDDRPTDYGPAQPPAAQPPAAQPAANAAASSRPSRAIAEAMRRARARGATGAVLVLRRGADTLAVEHVARDGRLLSATLSLPDDRVMTYSVAAHADGTAEHMEVSVTQFGDSVPSERFWASFPGDSILSRTAYRDRPEIHGAARLPHHVVPYIDPSPAMLGQIVRRARLGATGSVAEVPVLILGDPSAVVTAVVVFHGRDSVVVAVGDEEMRLAVDGDGRLLGGSDPDDGVTFERIELGPRAAVARRP